MPADEVPDRVAATVARLREVEKELAQLRAGQVLQRAGELAAQARDVFGFAYVGVEAPAGTPADLVRGLALDIRGRLAVDRPGAVLVAAGGDRVSLVAAVNEAGRARGLSASALLREAAPAVGGKGGGQRRRGAGRRQRRGRHRRRRCAWRSTSSAGSPRADGGRRGRRGRRRHGPGRRRRQRPAAGPGQPGRDGAGARLRAGGRRSSPSATRSGGRRACRPRCPARPARRRPTWPARGRDRLAPLVAPVPVELVDERLTTVTATAALRASGKRGQGRPRGRRPGRGRRAPAGGARRPRPATKVSRMDLLDDRPRRTGACVGAVVGRTGRARRVPRAGGRPRRRCRLRRPHRLLGAGRATGPTTGPARGRARSSCRCASGDTASAIGGDARPTRVWSQRGGVQQGRPGRAAVPHACSRATTSCVSR